MAVLNSTILERAWLSGTNDYQQRIPNPSTSSYAEHVAAIFEPMNNDLFNQFTGMLNGLIGTTVESDLFENPLAVLKKPAVRFGNSERAVAFKYLQAHSYAPDTETLLKVEKPEIVEWFYSVGTPRRYEFSWSRYELERAFASDGYGFDDMLTGMISQMYSSANYDEMNIMLQMFAEANQRFSALYNYNLSAAPTTESTAKELLTGIRAVAGRMKFPTTLYNHIDVPVHENGDGLVLFITPEAMANLDVQALAYVFQLDKADIQYRIIEVPEFPIPNVVAALCSEDFIYVRDVRNGIEPPFYNPENMTYKYYYHVAQLIGVNPAANCVLFSTNAGTNVSTVTMSLTGAAFSPDSGTVEIGGELPLKFALTGSVSGGAGKIAVEPDSATYQVSAARSGSDIPLNSRTYVDSYGILHVQKTGLAANDVITVTGTATYTNPSGSTSTYTDTFAATVAAAAAKGAKEDLVDVAPQLVYTAEKDATIEPSEVDAAIEDLDDRVTTLEA